METNLFSTYSAGENRVTGSILAVLRFLSLDRTERLLGALASRAIRTRARELSESAGEGWKGRPDAEIWASCRVLIETKTKRDAVDVVQLRRHLDRLHGRALTEVLLVLTPDERKPKVLESFRDDKRVAWASFSSLDVAIDDLLKDNREVVSEWEAFLLRQLQTMLEQEGLLALANEVLVVPARIAWDDYQRVHAYVCQPNRPFQPVKRIAFYTAGQIQPLVPTIIEPPLDSVPFERGKHHGRLGEIVERLLADGNRGEGSETHVGRGHRRGDGTGVGLFGRESRVHL